jgi:hypothetical protein
MSRAHGTIAIQERQGFFLPRAAAPPTHPARRGSPVDAPQSQAEHGAAQSGQAARDGTDEGQQGCPGASSGKTAAAGGPAGGKTRNYLCGITGNFGAEHTGKKSQIELQFGGLPVIKASLSFWYLPQGAKAWPLVGGFSFDYDVLEDGANDDGLEMYPRQTVEGANSLFGALRRQSGWSDMNATPKTAFALEVL